jgi:hypothetical protein
MSQSSDGACQKIPISEPLHGAGDGGTVVYGGGLVRIQESHEASVEVNSSVINHVFRQPRQSVVALQRQDLAASRGGSGSSLPPRQIVGC